MKNPCRICAHRHCPLCYEDGDLNKVTLCEEVGGCPRDLHDLECYRHIPVEDLPVFTEDLYPHEEE